MVMDRWKKYESLLYYRSQALSSRLGAATLRVCPTLLMYLTYDEVASAVIWKSLQL